MVDLTYLIEILGRILNDITSLSFSVAGVTVRISEWIVWCFAAGLIINVIRGD